MVRRFFLAVLVFLTLATPGIVRADTLDTVLQILWTAGVIDKGVVDAKPLVECLLQGNSVTTCSEQFAAQQAGQAASDIMAADPKITLVVEIIKAAQQSDWLTVLEIAGTDLLAQIACTAGIPGGGPVKSFICSGVFVEVAKKSKPVVKQVLTAVKSGAIDDWLMVAAMTGPSFACEIMPSSIPGKDMICSTLGQVLGGAAEAVADAADAVYGSAAAFGEWVSGQDKHMPTHQYYNLYWKPWYHYGVILQLRNPGGWGDLLKEIRDPCEDYFDSHTMSQDNAQDTCDDMRDRFSGEVTTFRKAIKMGPNAYLHAVMEPFSAAWAVADYGGGDTTQNHKNFIINGCETDLRAKFPFPEPDPYRCEQLKNSMPSGGQFAAIAEALYNKCLSNQDRQMPDPTAAEYLCTGLDASFENYFNLDKKALEQRLMNLVSTGSCSFPPGWDGPGVELNCVNQKAYEKCLDVLQADKPKQRCNLPKETIAEELMTKIGGERCRYFANTGDIECYRTWKFEKCETLLADYQNSIPEIANNLQCTYVEIPRFKIEIEKAEAIVAALNTKPPEEEATEPPAEPDGTAQNNDGPVLSATQPATLKPAAGPLTIKPTIKSPQMAELSVKPAVKMSAKPSLLQSIKNCTTTWDPVAIHCLWPDVLYELPDRLPGTTLPPCQPDPDQNGSNFACYSGAYPLPSDQQQTIPMPEPDKYLLPGDKKTGRAGPPILSVESGPGAMTIKLPDYRVADPLVVAGKQVSPGGIVELEAGDLKPGLGSRCLVAIGYTINNQSMTAVGPPVPVHFTIPGQPPVADPLPHRIQPDSGLEGDITLAIPSGTSTLTITVDPENQEKEINEGNNSATLIININGECTSGMPGTALAPIQQTGLQPQGLTLALPDYQVADSLTVANKQVNWSGIVDLAAAELNQGSDNTCTVKVRYTINNNSPDNATENTTMRWNRPGKPPLVVPLGGFKAHGQREELALFSIPSGINTLTLTIDPENKVMELNENNNTSTLTIRINGTCGTTVPQQTAPKLMPTPAPTLQKKLRPLP